MAGGVSNSHNSISPSTSPHRLSTASTVSGLSTQSVNSSSSNCCRLRYNQQNGTDYGTTPPQQQQQTSTNHPASSYTTLTSTTSSISSAASANTLNPNSSTPPTPLAVTPPKKSPKDFIFGKFIGEGSFSNVYLGVDINTKREYASKFTTPFLTLKLQKVCFCF